MRRVTYTGEALKALERIPATTARRIRPKIAQYATDPASLRNNVRKLQGREGYRLRVGDNRVFFDEDNVVLTVLQVGPRGSIYED